MRLVRAVVFPVVMELTISAGLYISSYQCDQGRCSLEDNGRLAERSQDDASPIGSSDESPWKPMSVKGGGDSLTLWTLRKPQERTRCAASKDQEVGPSRKARKQRRSTSPPSNNPTPREQRAESPNPTMREMRLVLSDEEVKAYIEHWRAGKEFQARLYQIEGGYVPTEEEKKQFDANRRHYNEAVRLRETVKRELIRTGRARPKMVESYGNRHTVGRSNARKRRKQLRYRLDNGMASPDEVAEYEELMATLRTVDQIDSNSRAKKKAAKNRLKELEKLVNDGVATDAQRAEYEDLRPKIQEQRNRAAESVRKSRARIGNRLEELERLVKAERATDGERAEYDILKAKEQRKKELHAKATKKYYQAKKKKAEISQGTPSPETGSEGTGQSNIDRQPLQSSSNPPLRRTDSLLNRLGKLWRETTRAPNRPWHISPPPRVAPPIPVPFGAMPRLNIIG